MGETVRRLLVDAGGDALCDSCLAFACSVSLPEMRQVTEELLGYVGFARIDVCASCRHTVPAIKYTAKCVYCARTIRPGDNALELGSDILHAKCFTVLASEVTIRTSRELCAESRRLIEAARHQMREERNKVASSG